MSTSASAEDTTLQQVAINVDETKSANNDPEETPPEEQSAVVETQQVSIELASAVKKEDPDEGVPEKPKEKKMTRVKRLKASRKVEVSLLELFDTLDLDDSGYLSNQEVLVGLHMLGLQVETSDLFQALSHVHSVDKGNGKMGPEKFLAFMKLISKTEDLELLNLLAEALNSGRINSIAIREKLALHQDDLDKGQSAAELKSSAKLELQDSKVSKEKVNKIDDGHFEEKDTVDQKLYTFFFVGKPFYLTVVLAWIFMGTLVYCVTNGWDFGRSFYYSIQAGLSIGFGSLSEDKRTGTDIWSTCHSNTTILMESIMAQFPNGVLPDPVAGNICVSYSEENQLSEWSKLYTCIHLMLGASIISGVLGLFATMAVESSDNWYEEVRIRLACLIFCTRFLTLVFNHTTTVARN